MKRRKKDDLESRKEEMLDVTFKFFLEKGFDQFSMEDLAKEMGCARRSLYTYFKSKNDIYMALYLRNVKIKSDALVEILKLDAPPDIVLTKFLQETYKISLKYKDFTKFQLKMDSSDFDWNLISAEYQEQYNVSAREYFDSFTNLIQRGIDTGIFKNDIHPRVIVAEMLYASRGVINRSILFSDSTYVIVRNLVTPEEFVNVCIRILVDGLRK